MIHIKRPIRPRFVARVRRRGYRKYEVVGEYRTSRQAALRMVDKFDSSYDFKRGDVLMIEKWYGPTQIMEITR
jgi:hypothetical protein